MSKWEITVFTMKYSLLALFVLATSVTFAQSFYDINNVQTIEITFAESNWDNLMDIAYASDAGYIMAQSVSINGVTFDSVGVKYKGNSSYNANQVKNPWHIELDTYKDHEYDGYTDIKLANGYKDPSMLRDVLGYQILRQYMEAPLANFANLYVNGNLIGLYSNTESISKKFMKKRFGSKENTRFKCSPPDGAGPQSNDYPNLVYLGQDSTNYYDSYELKSDHGWQELIDLCDTLANHIDDIDKILDVDRTLWMLAFDNVIVNLDSYIGAFSQNYYLYRSDFDRFLPVVWDLNESFGVFSRTGTVNLNNTTSKQQMTHLLHQNDSDFPLLRKLLSVPMYRRMYLAHIKTILLENFDNGMYYQTGLMLQSIIDNAIQADPNKFYTYNNFISNLTSDISSGGGPGGGNSAPGITNLMDARSDYLLSLNDFTQSEPVISDVILSNPDPVLNETITVTAIITDENSAYLGYRTETKAPFTRIPMYDDGNHNDGAVDDGVYGAELKITGASTQYYIYAENDIIGKFSPIRAEYEYHIVTASVGNPTIGDLVINEFMASNDTTAADQDGEYDDWIELYNNGTSSIDLSGYFITDDSSDLTQWTFPDGTSIEPDDYLIIWADDDEGQEGLHANFKLSSSGESVILLNADSLVVDAIDYPEQTTDISYARIPNGTGNFQLSTPTFSANNDISSDCMNAGGDADNDGICADEDCDDNDATIGAPQDEGTSCDDGNASTENDVIQADGCTCEGTLITVTDIVINEFMASNDTTVADQDGEYDDWIELYNNGTAIIDLSGYFITDDPSDLTQWTFADGTIIEPDGYLILWADDDEDQAGLHANFKLSSSGESIILLNVDTMVVDAIDYPEQTTDISYGRFPNGTGEFQPMSPTFSGENNISTSTIDITSDNHDLIIYPNPAKNEITVSSSVELLFINLYNQSGHIVLRHSASSKKESIDLSQLTDGIFFVQTILNDGKTATQKIIVVK